MGFFRRFKRKQQPPKNEENKKKTGTEDGIKKEKISAQAKNEGKSDINPKSDVVHAINSAGGQRQKYDIYGKNQKYEVYGELGKGGFGRVYLAYSQGMEIVVALKTFLDKYLEDMKTREQFRREANVWVDLERHPYIVRAYFVDEVNGQLYIAMEYIAPIEMGLNTLEHYLKKQPPDLAQSLRWAIQFCHGMEYAYSKGVRCHRDIKPANIMISQNKTVKITDFGLAGVLDTSRVVIKVNAHNGNVGFSIMERGGFGTPTHMPPEQFTDAAACDQRSDIYAFGVVLFQMAASGRLPFWTLLPKDDSIEEHRRFSREMHRLHSEAPVPKLNSPLFHIIQRCLRKEPHKRYQAFKELRADLEPLLKHFTGETVRSPELKDLEAWEWNNKGACLDNVGRFDEAIKCHVRALEINPQYALAWNNKGVTLRNLGRFDESVKCLNQALEINPQFVDAWHNKGISLNSLGRFDEAIKCYDKALTINPQHAWAWASKGMTLHILGRFDESVKYLDRALEINPQYALAWYGKGVTLYSLCRFDETIKCYDKALTINPQHIEAWNNKGACLYNLGRFDEAIKCYDKALTINPQHANAWFGKALAEDKRGLRMDAIRSYKRFVKTASAQYVMYLQELLLAHQRLFELE
jgi:serine/threonine protein kinase